MNNLIARWKQETKGAVTIEAALVLTILIILQLGVLEFGLIFYTKYAMTHAAREGARYGVIYRTDANGTGRILPSNLIPSIQQVVTNYLVTTVPSVSFQVAVSGPGFETGTPGADLTVQISCPNPWNYLDGFIPSLQNITFSAQCTMKCE